MIAPEEKLLVLFVGTSRLENRMIKGAHYFRTSLCPHYVSFHPLKNQARSLMVAFCFFSFFFFPFFGSACLKGKPELNVPGGRLVALRAKCLDAATLQ